ncbi:MAG: SIS domain-containing protein [Chloroflexi bacterium]|nr:SIS domain-containing protein [Chloroflexota bacterium]
MGERFPFLEDIQLQPEALQKVLQGYDHQLLQDLRSRLMKGNFDRIILTGMGASTFGTYPAWLQLLKGRVPAFWMDTSELLTYASDLVTPKSLLWVVSNSGKSIEITRLLAQKGRLGNPYLLANTNFPDSPLATQADLYMPIYSGDDFTLSTRSYVGTLATTQLMALQLAGKLIDREMEDLQITLQGLQEFTQKLEEHLQLLDSLIGKVNRLVIIGRGLSYATAMEAALCFKEGPKINAEGMSTGQFWHGPVELADENYTVLSLAGEAMTKTEDFRLSLKAQSLGAKVFWLADTPEKEIPSIVLPKYRGIGLPIAEIVPIQLISINIGKQTGFRPGDFRYLGTVVTTKKEMF